MYDSTLGMVSLRMKQDSTVKGRRRSFAPVLSTKTSAALRMTSTGHG